MGAGVVKVRIRGRAIVNGVTYTDGQEVMLPVRSAEALVIRSAAEYVTKEKAEEPAEQEKPAAFRRNRRGRKAN